jgi:hypothetical protein
MRRTPLLVASLFAILGAAGQEGRTAAGQPADAGPPPGASLNDSLSGAAKEAYGAATVLSNNKDCARAIEKYEEAYGLSKDPRLLFDIAVCERDLRAYARMRGLLLRYEEEGAATMSTEQKADVDAALAAIRDLVGTVDLTVSEAGADVTVDAEPVGTTPLVAPLVVDLGKHTLAVKKDGFEPAERTVEVRGGNETSVAITLVQRVHPALLRIASDPGATVVIDNKELSRGSFDGALAPGAHDVVVSEPGKKGYETRIILHDGEARTLRVTLEGERHAILWPWIAGGAAVVVGAGIGGYFLLRPHETRGPGPQGQLFTVQLPPGAN